MTSICGCSRGNTDAVDVNDGDMTMTVVMRKIWYDAYKDGDCLDRNT